MAVADNNQTSLSTKAFKLIIIIAVFAIALGVAGYLYASKPEVQKKRPPQAARTVEIMVVRASDQPVALSLMGTVKASREVTLKARVGGRLVSLSPKFMPGGRFAAGEEILRIEPDDYDLVLKQKQAALTKAQAALRLEEGQQEVAKKEWELLSDSLSTNASDRELALRQPQLEQARAAVAEAAAAVEAARLNLERTSVKAPFNAIVKDVSVNLGSQLAAQETLATLVGSDEYWVEVSTPADQLSWIIFPGEDGQGGSPALIVPKGDGPGRSGRVIRLLGEVESAGRMARLLVSVPEPLGAEGLPSGTPPLLLGQYVTVTVEGRAVRNAYKIPRTALHDGDTVWIMADGDTLDIRPAGVVWRDRETVLIDSGLTDGARLVVSDLSSPVQGMALRLPGAGASEGGKAKKEQSEGSARSGS